MNVVLFWSPLSSWLNESGVTRTVGPADAVFAAGSLSSNVIGADLSFPPHHHHIFFYDIKQMRDTFRHSIFPSGLNSYGCKLN